ncbi:MAG: hypothetical protein H0X40_10135 [Chthoniobacterales bacterium]|nr:hypothetical protein [Chthoniobacterales bacterium]
MSEQDSADLFDLKMLPAWATESPNENRYADFAGEAESRPGSRGRHEGGGGGERRERGPRPPRRDGPRRDGPRREQDRRPATREPQGQAPRRVEENFPPAPAVMVRFSPDPRALENVLAQIKSGHVAYSVFSLARMFLEKPERYDVLLQTEGALLFQMGEKGAVASDRRILENGAFAREIGNFYRTEVTQSEPIKGNFTSVARDRLSGTLLGPTNHHAYQTKLRSLYEQRFSRRMSFPDYQRQIEIINDPETVERWKEEARSVTTYTTLKEEPEQTFGGIAETERHFRQNYLPGLLREAPEVTIDGVVSRQLPDRALGHVIEQSWTQESRSPSKMMQELIAGFPKAGLHIFRHRKGMLFVSPIRPRPFPHEGMAISSSLGVLLRVLADAPGIKRNQLLEKLPGAVEGEIAPNDGDLEKKKLTLASDLRWLVSEGYVIEFNDGSLDLTRGKTPSPGRGPKPGADLPNESKPEDAAVEISSETQPLAPPNEPPEADAVSAPAENIPSGPGEDSPGPA